MTMRQQNGIVGLTLTLAVGVLVVAAGVVAARSASAMVHIELVIEEMTFRSADALADAAAPNPTLRVRSGQPVELVLRNLDPGMKHDLVIPDLKLQMNPVQNGETATARFIAPAPGIYPYFCSMHPKLMRGELIVSP